MKIRLSGAAASEAPELNKSSMKILASVKLSCHRLPFTGAVSETHRLFLNWSQFTSWHKGLLPQVECVPRALLALRCPAALSQDAVQAVELAQETSVRDDATVVFYCFDCLHERQVLSDHQVGKHQSS